MSGRLGGQFHGLGGCRPCRCPGGLGGGVAAPSEGRFLVVAGGECYT